MNSETVKLRYQWQRLDISVAYENALARAEAWEDIPGETGNKLAFSGIDEQAYASEFANTLFRCIVSTEDDAEISSEAKLLFVPDTEEAEPEAGDAEVTVAEPVENEPLPEEDLPENSEAPEEDSKTVLADPVYSGTCGDGVNWEFIAETGTLNISGSGRMSDIRRPWSDYDDNIITVNIQSGVTHVGDNSFSNMPNLKTVSIASSVINVGMSAFSNCAKLENVDLKGKDIGTDMFRNCTALKSVTIPNDTAQKIGDGAFAGCTALESATIMFSVKEIGDDAFKGCTALKSISITTNVKTLGESIFENCTSLTSVTLNNKIIGQRMFKGCTALESITIPSKVLTVGDSAFENCTGLKDITIDNTVIGKYMFRGCTGLEHITIPDKISSFGRCAFENCTGLKVLDVHSVHIGDYWFCGCTGITELVLSSDVRNLHLSAFQDCTGLVSVTIPSSVGVLNQNVFQNCTSLKTINLQNQIIGDFMFKGCTGLESVTIPGNINEIGNYAFKDCTGIQSVTIESGPGRIGIGVFEACRGIRNITMRNSRFGKAMFNNCTGLESLTVPGCVTDPGSDTFRGCTSLHTLILENEVIGTNMFEGCTGLTGLVIPGNVRTLGDGCFNNCSNIEILKLEKGVRDIGANAFSGCSRLKKVFLAKGIMSIGLSAFGSSKTFSELFFFGTKDQWRQLLDSYTRSGNNALTLATVYLCKRAEEFGDSMIWVLDNDGTLNIVGSGSIPDQTYDAAAKTTGAPWFEEHENIKEVVLGDGVTVIGKNAFRQLEALKSVTLLSGMQTVGNGAFADCSALETLLMPGTLTTVKENAFSGCTSLSDVTYTGPDWANVTVEDGNECLLNAEIKKISPIQALTIKAPDDTDITDTEVGIDLRTEPSIQLSIVKTPDSYFGYTLSCHDTSVATVNETGLVTFLKAGTAVITAKAADTDGVTASVIFQIHDGVASVTLRQDKLVMKQGERIELRPTCEPSFFTQRIVWTTEDESVATVDDEGTVTAIGQGTTYITASVTAGETTFTARCRVDVVPGEGDRVESVQLITSVATVYVFKTTDYPRVSVLTVLSQNQKQMDDTPLPGPAAAITAARFENEDMNAYFRLRVADDSTLEILPKYLAVNDAQAGSKALKSSYTSKLILTVDEQEYTTSASLKLTVKKTKPTVKAGTAAFNSLLPEEPLRLEFTGEKVFGLATDDIAAEKAKKPAIPEYMTFDEETGTLALVPDAAYASKGNLYLLVTLEDWAIPVSVKVPFTIKKTVPKLSFNTKSVSLLQGRNDEATVEYTVSPEIYSDPSRFPVTVTKVEIKGASGYTEIENYTDISARTVFGLLILSAPNVSGDEKAHTYRVTLSCNGTDVTYTVKTRAASTEPQISVKSSGGINTQIPGSSLTLTVTPKNFHESESTAYSLVKIQKCKGSAVQQEYTTAEEIADLFTVTQKGNVFVLTGKADALESGYTYKAELVADMNADSVPDGTTPVTLKISFPKTKPPVSLTVKKSGSLDLTRPQSAITLVPTVKNWVLVEELIPVFFKKEGKTNRPLEAGEQTPFTYTLSDGVFTFRVREDWTQTTSAYSVKIKAKLSDGSEILSRTATALPVKQGKVSVKSSVSSLTMYKNDCMSRAPFRLTVADSTVAPIERVELDAVSAEKFEIVSLGRNGWELKYKDDTMPAKFTAATVKLSLYVYGCANSAATVKLKVTYK